MNLSFMAEMRLSSARDAFLLDCKVADMRPRTLSGYRGVLA